MGLGLLASVAVVLYFPAKRGRLGGERFRGFSRNAKLLLIRSPFSGLSVSLLRLLFNLYLLAVGFDLLFVAKFAAIQLDLSRPLCDSGELLPTCSVTGAFF